jgi:hypothetical protein
MIVEFLIALDQLVNTLVYSSDDGRFGRADETLSARCWRLRNVSTFWSRGQRFVDFLFFWDKDHCFNSFKTEVLKAQLPFIYRKLKSDLLLFYPDLNDADITIYLKNAS